MASLPQRPASQRRSSPEQSTDASPSQSHRSSSRARSTISEDSQTVLLNPPSPASTSKPAAPTTSSPPPQADDDVRKCWICFADETEDTAETSGWRSPCPCALVAHEDCLLDWIADMESPSSRKRTLGPPKLLCPQCKSEIHLARPYDPIVETVRATERVIAKAIAPTALSVAVSTLVATCSWHGVHSVNMIFGPRDGWRILQPVLAPDRWTRPMTLRMIADDIMKHWRIQLGLPLITPMLVLSRTTLADSVLPVLPIVFFATQGDSDQPLDFGHWPPSASLTMAVLPYLRGVYNAYYERFWAPHERRWLKEIQPRNGQSSTTNDDNANNNGEENPADDAEPVEEEGIFEIRVDGNIWDNWDEGEDQPQRAAQQNAQDDARMEQEIREDMLGEAAPAPDVPRANNQQAPALNAPPLPDNGPQPQAQPQAQPQQAQERRLSISTTGLAEKVLGALLFPTVAALSGEALRLLLPTSWTTIAVGSSYGFTLRRPRATGLLQERWGRSIVGGCLFVALKDAVMLYVRWKMARQHRRRRVLDYDRKKGRVVGR